MHVLPDPPVLEELHYFFYLQTFGSGHTKSTLSPNPQQKEFQMHSVTRQGNRSIYL